MLEVQDPADLKERLSAYLRLLPASERLKTTIGLINSTRVQALQSLKTMWALCEIVEKEDIWRLEFNSLDDFKRALNYEYVINQMLEQYEFVNPRVQSSNDACGFMRRCCRPLAGRIFFHGENDGPSQEFTSWRESNDGVYFKLHDEEDLDLDHTGRLITEIVLSRGKLTFNIDIFFFSGSDAGRD